MANQAVKGQALPIKVPPFQFPSTSTSDRYLIETYDHANPRVGPEGFESGLYVPDYGFAHPSREGFFLVRIVPSGEPNVFSWVWRNESTVSDNNNFVTSYEAESRAHPTFVRRYVRLRETVARDTPPAMLTPLTAVIGLIGLVGGSGSTKLKNGTYNLVFTDQGDGTGVAGKFQVSNRKVVAQWLTSCGSGYVAAPTVICPGVDEAQITAYVQPQGALLVHEEASPADGQETSIFLNVTLMYQTLPGPVLNGLRYDHDRVTLVATTQQTVASTDALATSPAFIAGNIELVVSPQDTNRSVIRREIVAGGGTVPDKTELIGLDDKTGAGIYRTTKYVSIGTAKPTFDDQINGRYVFDVKEAPYSDVEKMQMIYTVEFPDSYSDFPLVGFQFPAVFTVNDFTWTDYSADSRFPYPHPGNPADAGFFFLEAHRQSRWPARQLHVFTFGQPAQLDAGFVVSTPGVMSSYFKIPQNCIHEAFKIYEEIDSVVMLVENIPASTPAKYKKGDIITLAATSSRWRGKIYETVVTQLAEDGSLTSFGNASINDIFSLQNLNDGFEQIDTIGKVFIRSRSSYGNTYKLNGFLNDGTRSTATISVPSGLDDTKDYLALSDIALGGFTSIIEQGLGPSVSASIYAEGDVAGTWLLDKFSGSNVTDGNTVKFVNGPVEVTYRFKTVIAQINDVLIGVNIDASVLNLARVLGNTGTSGTDWYAGSTHITDFTYNSAVAGQITITDKIRCHRTFTAVFTGATPKPLEMFAQVVGIDGLLICSFAPTDPAPCCKVNLIKFDQGINKYGNFTFSDVGNVDPYIEGTCAELVIRDKAGKLQINAGLPISGATGATTLQVFYQYKVAGSYVTEIAVGTNLHQAIAIPQTTGLRVRVLNGATRAYCYVAFKYDA